MNWDYIAGFIDGEGTLTYARSKTSKGTLMIRPTLLIFQSSISILELIRDFIGQGTILNDSRSYDMYRYQLNGQARLKPVLEKLIPRLIVKQLHAENLLSFIDCRIPLKGLSSSYDNHCLDLNKQMYTLNEKPGKTPEKLALFNEVKKDLNLFSRGYS